MLVFEVVTRCDVARSAPDLAPCRDCALEAAPTLQPGFTPAKHRASTHALRRSPRRSGVKRRWASAQRGFPKERESRERELRPPRRRRRRGAARSGTDVLGIARVHRAPRPPRPSRRATDARSRRDRCERVLPRASGAHLDRAEPGAFAPRGLSTPVWLAPRGPSASYAGFCGLSPLPCALRGWFLCGESRRPPGDP